MIPNEISSINQPSILWHWYHALLQYAYLLVQTGVASSSTGSTLNFITIDQLLQLGKQTLW